ncbi:MAG: hypothetical protein ACU836_11295 [Gammaproteobacteria bacterium]
MKTICEACEITESSIVEECDDPVEPYHLCKPCYKRLRARSLRPLEWYNLAKRHGWFQFLLHDDFYDEAGTASQPEEDVETPELFPAPILHSVLNEASLLLDYSITQWHFKSDVEAAWNALPRTTVLKTLSDRFSDTSNVGIRSRILEICASSIKTDGAEFVREAWAEYPGKVDLISLAEASASCLPYREGFDKVQLALSELSGPQKREQMLALAFFASTETLEWIEKNIFSPITDSWAYLAAASDLSWQKITSWLEAGRPLSLVAIDALRVFQRLPTPFLRKRGVKLIDPPTEQELMEKLKIYAKRDNAPRVEQRVGWVLQDMGKITKSG